MTIGHSPRVPTSALTALPLHPEPAVDGGAAHSAPLVTRKFGPPGWTTHASPAGAASTPVFAQPRELSGTPLHFGGQALETSAIAAAKEASAAEIRAAHATVAGSAQALVDGWQELEVEADAAWDQVETLLRETPPDYDGASRIVGKFLQAACSLLVTGARACLEASAAYPGGEEALMADDPDAAAFIETARLLAGPFWDEMAIGKQAATEAWQKQLADDETSDLLAWLEARMQEAAEVEACERMQMRMRRADARRSDLAHEPAYSEALFAAGNAMRAAAAG